jgi:hypothetical protein
MKRSEFVEMREKKKKEHKKKSTSLGIDTKKNIRVGDGKRQRDPYIGGSLSDGFQRASVI